MLIEGGGKYQGVMHIFLHPLKTYSTFKFPSCDSSMTVFLYLEYNWKKLHLRTKTSNQVHFPTFLFPHSCSYPAVCDFLQHNNLLSIIRAHEAQDAG